jgi:hypothetical protein
MKTILAGSLSICLFLSTSANAWTLVSPNLQGWANHNIVVHYNFSACGVDAEQMLGRLDLAIAAWNKTSGSNLSVSRPATASSSTAADFLAGTTTNVPLVVCDQSFATSNSVDADFIPAATRLSMPTGRIEYGGVLLNAEASGAASMANLSEEQIIVTLAHELGHVFGLGHSSSNAALMYYSINDKVSPIVTEDDLDGVAFLYPRNEFSGGMFGCSFVPAKGTSMPWPLAVGFLSFIWISVALGRSMRITSERLL